MKLHCEILSMRLINGNEKVIIFKLTLKTLNVEL